MTVVSVQHITFGRNTHPVLLVQLLEVGDVDAEVLIAREQNIRHAELAQLVQEGAGVLRESNA